MSEKAVYAAKREGKNVRPFEGKRLLVLGGQRKLCDIVNKAHEMGMYVVVTDWYEDSPAKALADKAYGISTADEKAVLALIEQEKIDGVYTGFIDSALPYYYSICKKAGLPCGQSPAVLEACTNKRKFKTVCRKVGIETIPDYRIDPKRMEESLKKLDFPVVVKPVDNSGSKGITICTNEWTFATAYERALRFSRSKDVLVEKFLYGDFIVAYYAVQDGDCRLTMLFDKDMNHIGKGFAPFPAAFVYPSIYRERYRNEVDGKVKQLVEHLGLKNGVFLIGFFVNNHHFYAVKLTVRLTATREYRFVKEVTGVDLLEKQLAYAVSGLPHGEPPTDMDKQMADDVCCLLPAFVNEGTIGKIEGLEEIRTLRGVLDVLQLRFEGDRIRADGSYGQMLARIWLHTKDKRDMVELVREVQQRIRVFDTDGRLMLMSGFDANRFFL